jgi:uncharacterized surface protein with fasciclin (FAS1) repeats/formylglycine-generating enzyme required for sulfatase activity/beta-lactamase regulating signal transducer with metallopeptidase domain
VTALFLDYALGNTLLAIPLALVAWMLGRWRRYPSLAHLAWVLVMVRLVMPPIAALPSLSLSIPLLQSTAAMADSRSEQRAWRAPAEKRGSSTDARVPLPEITVVLDAQGRSLPLAQVRTDPVPRDQRDMDASRADAPRPAVEELIAVPSASDQRRASVGVEARIASFVAANSWVLAGALWLAGTALIVTISAIRIMRFRRGVLMRCEPAWQGVLSIARSVADELGLRRRFVVLTTQADAVPFVWSGLGGPVIVLPTALVAGNDEVSLRLILMHELAHIRRRDHLVRWLDWAVVAWLWWNPLAWIARRGLRSCEELACDALVMRTCGASPREYGACLVAAAESLAGSAFRAPAQACTMGDGGSLECRIKVIMSGSLQRRPSLRLRVVIAGLAAASLLSGVVTMAGAQSPPNGAVRGRSFFDGRGKPNIVDTAVAAKFQTLVAAVQAAGLTDLLRSEGPFTVFAPTDEAFAALPAGTLDSLLLPENKETLRDILAHHVVPGRLLSMEVANIEDPQMARTAAGDRETIGADRQGFRFGEAEVIRPDILCGNGVIHVIDRVVLPKPSRTEESMGMAMKEAAPARLLDALRAVPDGRYSTFVAAVEASGGDQDWAQAAPDRSWTVFVPTNEAFARLSDAERATLLDPKNRETLRAVLDWHALPKLQPWSFDLNAGDRAPVMISENNDRFVLDVLASGAVYVYRIRSMRDRSLEEPFKARIIAGDIPVGSSVVHVVDRVLVPPQFENSLIASQAYPEKDVKELAMAADAQFMAVYELRAMLKQAESMDDAAAVAVYRVGLRMLEEVVPLNRDGMVIMGDEQSNDRTVLRDRLRARIDDLDRVWYAKFMKGSPPTTSLSEPVAVSTVPARGAAPASAVPAAPVERGTAGATGAVTPLPAPEPAPKAASVRPPANLDWCEIIERDVDPTVVTDGALREAIVRTGLPWRVRDKASGIEMLLVPPGQFMMGKSAGDTEALANEVPAHSVTLTQPYYLGRYEVTKEQWAKVLGGDARTGAEPVTPGVQGVQVDAGGGRTVVVSGGYELVDSKGNPVPTRQTAEAGPNGTVVFTTTPAEAGPAGPPDTRSGLPVTAGWSKTAEFCRVAGMRLPTEAEWEYACRAGVQAPRYGELDAIAWHRGNSDGRNHPVGTKAANALGFHDMIGNAWEWVSDWYGDYTRSAKTDPIGPETGTSRIVRGSFFDFEDGFCRASRRYEIQSADFGAGTGFRVARNP